MSKLTITVDIDEEGDFAPNATRYQFSLHAGRADAPQVTRQFIIDVPQTNEGTTDVWVDGHEVAVGDTPADGFATYTPIPEDKLTRIPVIPL